MTSSRTEASAVRAIVRHTPSPVAILEARAHRFVVGHGDADTAVDLAARGAGSGLGRAGSVEPGPPVRAIARRLRFGVAATAEYGAVERAIGAGLPARRSPAALRTGVRVVSVTG